MKPIRIINRSGINCHSLASALGLQFSSVKAIAFVGGGGKTSSIRTLAAEASLQGLQVIITTTTHMADFETGSPNISVRGTPSGSRLISLPPDELAELPSLCDLLLIEADGTRRLPLKAPADHEPQIPSFCDFVIAVLGLKGIGKTFREACHRPELACALLGRSQDDLITPRDCAALLLSSHGQRKNVGDRLYAVILNQADTAQDIKNARAIISALGDVPCAVTSYALSDRTN